MVHAETANVTENGLNSGDIDVTLLWIESTRAGSAARTHFDGSRARLEIAGIEPREVFNSVDETSGLVARLRRLGSLVRGARRAARRAGGPGVLIARWHPFLAFVSPYWIRRGGGVLLLAQGNDEAAFEANPWLRRVPGIHRLVTRSLRASHTLTVNEGVAEWVRSAQPVQTTPVDVMATGVSDLFFDAEPVDQGRYALFFGGLAPWQGVDYMLEAYASSAWPAGVDLVIIGGGAGADTVRAAQDEHLRYLGQMPQAEVAEWVAGALCTLCPKSNTGSMARMTTPFKILESVAAGVPVIATDIPAQVDLLQDGYGILVDVDRPVALAEAVASLDADDALRQRLADTAAEVAPRYRWTASAGQLAAAISDVAGHTADRRSA